MKNINDLKENKAVIIETITLELNAASVKKVMDKMVEVIGFNGYFGMDAKEFTKAIIADFNIMPFINKQRVEDMQIQASLNQRGSSMR